MRRNTIHTNSSVGRLAGLAIGFACAAGSLHAAGPSQTPPAPPSTPVPATAAPANAPATQPATAAPSIFDDAPTTAPSGPEAPTTAPATDPKAAKLGPDNASPPRVEPIAPPIVDNGETPEQSFARIYTPHIRKLTDTPYRNDFAIFARQLYTLGLQLPTPSPMQKLMLHKSYEFGARGRFGYATAVDALRALGRIYPEDKDFADERELLIYEEAVKYPKARLKQLAEAYTGKLDAMAQEKLRQNDIDGAIATYERGIKAERYIGKQALLANGEKIRNLREKLGLTHRLNGLKDAVQRNHDPKMAGELIKFSLLDWSDPNVAADALPYADAKLRSVATSAIVGVERLNEMQAKEYGDWYRDHYKEATRILDQASAAKKGKAGYDRALSLHPVHDVGWLELEQNEMDLDLAARQTEYRYNLALAAQRKRDADLHMKRPKGSPRGTSQQDGRPNGGQANGSSAG